MKLEEDLIGSLKITTQKQNINPTVKTNKVQNEFETNKSFFYYLLGFKKFTNKE